MTSYFPIHQLADPPARSPSLPPPPRWGVIDRVHGRWVEGWARNPTKLADSVRVICLLDGEVAGFAVANQVRPELSGPGHLVGAHGFRCEVPARKLHRARVITCVADGETGLTLIHERVRPRPAAAAPADRPAIHFDISDLLEFLVNHREVSGIQRVQCGYLSNALGMTSGDLAVRVCAQVPDECRYIEIPNERAASILQAIEHQRMLPMAEWQEFIRTERLGSGQAPAFARGDIILTMGAPWVHDDYFVAIAAAKAEHGVRYFQIFHDLIPTLVPEVVSIGLIGGFTRSMAGMLDCADHVLANSRYSDSDLRRACAQLGLRCPPTSVIPLGGTLDYGQTQAKPSVSAAGFSPSERYGEFVLCVGTIEPRKNHQYLYYVWKRLLAKFGTRTPKLICIGRMGWHVDDLQRMLKVSANLEGYFIHLTDVGDAELIRFYRDCLFTVFPSLYEGWGLPVAESLLYGKICVTSHATSMPEVGGDWVPYIDPHNIDNGVECVSGLLSDRTRLAAMETRLRTDYRPITWAAATRGLLGVIAAADAVLPPPHDPQRDADPSGLVVALGQTYAPTAAPPDLAPLAALRAEVDVRSVERLLCGSDWHRLEEWGCWSCGLVARLGFGLPEPARSRLFCYLSIRLPPITGIRHCDILIDGLVSQRIDVTGGKDYDLRLNLAADTPSCREPRRVRIDVRIDQLFEPDARAVDQRVLGIGVRSLCVCAADDVTQRLAHLEQKFQSVA